MANERDEVERMEEGELVLLATVRDRQLAAEVVDVLREAGVTCRSEPTGRAMGERGVYVLRAHVERAEFVIEQYRQREGVGAMDVVMLRGLGEGGSTRRGRGGGHCGESREGDDWGGRRGVLTVGLVVLMPVGLVLTMMFLESNQHAAVRLIGPMMLAAGAVCVAAALAGRQQER